MKSNGISISDNDILEGIIEMPSGNTFDVFNPSKDDIKLTDIAHRLSLICRFGGSVKRHYSVAEHTLNGLEEAKVRGFTPNEMRLWMAHDMAEAYVGDISRPIKKAIPQFTEIEDSILDLIYEKYDIDGSASSWECVKNLDNDLCYLEAQMLMTSGASWWGWKGERVSAVGQTSLAPQNFLSIEDIERIFLCNCYVMFGRVD